MHFGERDSSDNWSKYWATRDQGNGERNPHYGNEIWKVETVTRSNDKGNGKSCFQEGNYSDEVLAKSWEEECSRQNLHGKTHHSN